MPLFPSAFRLPEGEAYQFVEVQPGLYSFTNAYEGNYEFFPGRPVPVPIRSTAGLEGADKEGGEATTVRPLSPERRREIEDRLQQDGRINRTMSRELLAEIDRLQAEVERQRC